MKLPLSRISIVTLSTLAFACATTSPDAEAFTATTPQGTTATALAEGAPRFALPSNVDVVAEARKDRFLLVSRGSRLARELGCTAGSPVRELHAIGCASKVTVSYVHLDAMPGDEPAARFADHDFLELRRPVGENVWCGLDDTLRHHIDAFRETVPTTPNGSLRLDVFVRGTDGPHVRMPVEPSVFPELASASSGLKTTGFAPSMLPADGPAPVTTDTNVDATELTSAAARSCTCTGGWGFCVPASLGPHGDSCLSFCSGRCYITGRDYASSETVDVLAE